ncbi:MAG: PKD domain-containing protein [Candidatus Thermoplasmatota archaeon]|nr:PKD domain-containing protein [Candidatus Thermoplasmatota archaeon]
MRKVALALILIGLMVAVGFASMMDVVGNAEAEETEPASAEEPTRTDAHNKMDQYPQWSGWNDENYNQPWNQRWHNWSNYLEYYPQREFWARCKNMTEDYQWLDDINATTNGDEVGLMKEDINITYTEDHPMNFSYPRTNRQLTAQYDTSMNDMGVINLTINPLGLISMGTNPLMGRGKMLEVQVWVDTDGDYDFENPSPSAAIEGMMQFDFDWWNSPYDPMDPANTLDPYTTNSSEMWKTQRQMEESMDGLGYWLDIDDDGRPNIPGDISGGRIWVLIWRIDNQPDDSDNRTMDLLLYCGYTGKLSWITLPYKHPQQLPVADTGVERGFPENKDNFLRPKFDPRYQAPIFTEQYPQLKEGDILFLDGRRSYDPQDDVGADGIGYGNPDWPGADIGEDNKNIDDGDGYADLPEDNLGEKDTLKYKWEGETSINNKPYKITMTTGWQVEPTYEWKIRLPAMDQGLPAEEQYQIINITLTVMDRDQNQGTHTIQLLAYKSQNAPRVSVSVIPQIPKSYAKKGEAYVLPQRELSFSGYAFDPDPNSELSYSWLFEGPYDMYTREDQTFLRESFDEPGDWRVTLTVYDGPTDNVNTLSGNATLLLHVISNGGPVAVIRGSHNANMVNAFYEEFQTSKNRLVYFNGSESYDPDIMVETEDQNGNVVTSYEGLPGFDEDEDDIPDIGLKYQWDWGDGTRTEGFVSNPQSEHRWSERGAASNGKLFWGVKLKVWDNDIITESEPYRVYVNLPPTANAGPNRPTQDEGEFEVGMNVTFDGRKSYDPNDDPNYDMKRDSEYTDNLIYIWDFGDGSKQIYGDVVTHLYSASGTFTVRLTISDGEYPNEDEALVKIIPANLHPVGVVEITAPDGWRNLDNKEVDTNNVLVFDASGSFDPDGEFYNDDQVSTSPLDDLYGLTWDLGDGTISKQPKVDHIYKENGTYVVKINMSDRKQAKWEASYTITVMNRVPIAVIKDTNPSYYMDEQPVMLSGDGSYDLDGNVIGYYWEFGDGTHSDLTTGVQEGYQPTKVATHRYDNPGDYTVKLWVMDDDHTKSDTFAEVTVRILAEPPNPPVPIGTGVIIGGILAAVTLMGIGTSFFAWSRKRN